MNSKKMKKQGDLRKNNQKTSKGITLIALVITIIVLLILVGISIATLAGENGILTRANNAKQNNEIGWEKEVIQLALGDIRINNNGVLKLDKETLKKALEDNSGVNGINVEKEVGYIVTFPESKRQYEVYEDGSIEDATILKTNDTTLDTIEQKNDDVYVLQSIEDIVILSKNVKNGNNYSGKTFELEIDLDFKNENSYIDAASTAFGDVNGDGKKETLIVELTTAYGFNPIGTHDNPFEGNIEGNNNKIKNLYMRIAGRYTGFIAEGQNNTINNLNLINVDIQTTGSWEDCAAIVGELHGSSLTVDNCLISGKIASAGACASGILGNSYYATDANIEIRNCVNYAEISGVEYVGGIVGKADNVKDIVLENCTNNGIISSSTSTCGGIIAGTTSNLSNTITIKNCTNLADISSDRGIAAGIIGTCTGKTSSSDTKVIIENCSNTAKIKANGSYVGGITGELYYIVNSQIKNCYNAGEINLEDVSSASYIGGITGRAEKNANISLCYNTGKINATNSNFVGGIVGSYEGTVYEGAIIEKSYNKGEIYGNSYIGGIMGNNSSSSVIIPIKYCYNIGNISGKSYIGGIGGNVYAKILNCYNMANISGELNAVGGICGKLDSDGDSIAENTYNVGIITNNESANTGGIIGIGKKILNSYNFGQINVPTGKNYTGAVVGYIYSGGDASKCYYVQSTYNVGLGYGTDPTIAKATESELKQILNESFYEISGWKLDTNNQNKGYPVLDF